MKLLHIDAGITGPNSVSRQLSAAIVEAMHKAAPGLELVRRDLDSDPIAHLDSRSLAALRPVNGAGQAHPEAAKELSPLQEFLDADVVVIGAPMYNLGISSHLKAWFDRILVAGKTFRYTESGPQGLASGKKVVIASARGGLYGPGTPQAASDFHEPYLRALFRFIGINDIEVIRAEGVSFSPDHRETAVRGALASVPEIVAAFAPAVAA